MLTLFFDGTLAVLLGVAIVYCVKLNRRIRELQDSRSALAEYVTQFDEATSRATASIMEIQNASKKITQNIEVRLEKANYLADDLTFLVERGIRLADQLETLVGGSELKKKFRAPQKEIASSRVPPPMENKAPSTLQTMLQKAGLAAKPAPRPALKSQAERELRNAVVSARTAV